MSSHRKDKEEYRSRHDREDDETDDRSNRKRRRLSSADHKKTRSETSYSSGGKDSSRASSRAHSRRHKHRKHHNKRHGSPKKEAPTKPKASRHTDSEGHFIYELGQSITERYKILKFLGEGTFARVFECWDRKEQRYVALKVIRAVKKYQEAAEIEVEILQQITEHDPESKNHCIKLISSFDYHGHTCLVFEKLAISLYDFLRKNNYKGYTYDAVRHFAQQLLEGIAFMHDLTLIHTDLKPENILLVNSEYTKEMIPKRARHPGWDDPSSSTQKQQQGSTKDPKKDDSSSCSSEDDREEEEDESSSSRQEYVRRPVSTAIRIIDFGSATLDTEYHSSIISTRHYRAPEVILGLGWTFPADIWSIGCILAELYTGDALFQTHENREHLAMMEKVLGKMPSSMTLRADEYSKKYFDEQGNLRWPQIASSQESVDFVTKLEPLRDLFSPEHTELCDLISQMLRYEPSERLNARAALSHPFFTRSASAASSSS